MSKPAGSDEISARLAKLSPGQIGLLNTVIDTFEQPIRALRSLDSDVVDEPFLTAFGDVLKLHHSLSQDYLDKHRFEAVVERICRAINRTVDRPGRCNPGHDITVGGVAWSLKTQDDRNIKRDFLHISKFMELGKGAWKSKADLAGLRDQFLAHMKSYERLFQLRYFKLGSDPSRRAAHYYELVEIPKPLLQEASGGTLEMVRKSRQSPKPGYCTVQDAAGVVKFRLYFDGGTERKLQIRELRKDLCVVHAQWEF